MLMDSCVPFKFIESFASFQNYVEQVNVLQIDLHYTHYTYAVFSSVTFQHIFMDL